MKLVELKNICKNLEVEKECDFEGFTLMGKGYESDKVLLFLGSVDYIPKLLSVKSAGVICNEKVLEQIKDVYTGGLAVSDNPRGAFFHCYEEIAKKDSKSIDSIISQTAKIHHTAIVSEHNVTIGDNVTVGAHTIIKEGVTIGDNVIIEENCVLGCVALYTYLYNGQLKSFKTSGETIINQGVHIYMNTTIDGGPFNQPTIIGEESQIGGGVLIGHNTNIGKKCMIAGKNITGGWVKIGNETYSGINATYSPNVIVGNGAYICAGSVVLKDVKENVKVMGNPARRVE